MKFIVKDATIPWKKAPEDKHRVTFHFPAGLIEKYNILIQECFLRRDVYTDQQLQFEIPFAVERIERIKKRLFSRYDKRTRIALTLDVETVYNLNTIAAKHGVTRDDLMTNILLDWVDENGKLYALRAIVHQG